MATHHLSRSAYDRLKAELADLTTRGRIEIAKKIEAARLLGDLSENGDYHAAKDEQGHMEGRIRHLEHMLDPDNHTIVEAGSDGSAVGGAKIFRMVPALGAKAGGTCAQTAVDAVAKAKMASCPARRRRGAAAATGIPPWRRGSRRASPSHTPRPSG